MLKQVIEAGYYFHIMFDNTKDAVTAYEALSKGKLVKTEYLDSKHAMIPDNNTELSLKQTLIMSQEEFDLAKEALTKKEES